MRWPLASLAVMCTTNVVLGAVVGYEAAPAYVVFWAFALLLVITAWNVAARALAPTSVIDACIRAGVAGFGVIVLCGFVLGTLGRLTITGYFVALVLCCAASFLLPPRAARFVTAEPPAVPAFVVAIVGALLAFAVAFATTHSPLTLYDSLSYHLFFAARWLQDGVLSIVPTPFSDEAQAYAPANGELFFLWLMLPFHGDVLARMGQFPFALLAGVALYALARRLGARPEQAVYPPAFFLLSRPVLEQAIGANVDLICASMFLTSLYLGIVAVDRNDRRDWLLWGVSLGLYGGSKYVALVYMPIFLLLAAANSFPFRSNGFPFRRMLWALPGISAFALPWYLRNWIVAGSPIYPATLKVGGLTLATGAFTREAMANTVFHTGDLRLLPAMAAHAFGPTLCLLWIPFALVGGAAMVVRGWWPTGFVVLVPALMGPLYWFGFPVNVDSRFLMPAIGPALLPFAFAFQSRRTWNMALHLVYVIGMLWILVGVRAEIPAALPWFMSGWLALNGLLDPAFVLWFGAVVTVIGIAWSMTARTPRIAVALTGCLCVAFAAVFAVGGERWCRPARCDYLDTTSPHIRPDLIAGWQWVADHVEHSTIAYTGINLPYPLTGEQLTNRVVYANIDGRLKWRFHDYDLAYRAGRFSPVPPLLATSSGELMPVARRAGPRDDAVRPRYGRMQGLREAWVDNLKKMRVNYLFVAALSAYEIDYVWHNERGFPVEDEWAKADARVFQLVFENFQVRVYRVELPIRGDA